jgi:hypothetical protein
MRKTVGLSAAILKWWWVIQPCMYLVSLLVDDQVVPVVDGVPLVQLGVRPDVAPRPIWSHLRAKCNERDSATRFSTSGFLHGSVSPKPLITPLGSFKIFPKICGDIRSSKCTTSVIDTGGKWKKSSIRKICIICFGHLWVWS